MKICRNCKKNKKDEGFYFTHRNSSSLRPECIKCHKKEQSVYDWRKIKIGWQYSTDAPKNKKWQKDRDELFKKNGNGWWRNSGFILRKKYQTLE
ncbi:MAG: hypothetical protein H8E55_08170 [Pelagibacterales bacterium]|nr:hypothetical protein [Pelagibacterales bacterium]